MPLTPEWAIFFSAELAALATLTGLVVVAISINLPRILSSLIYPLAVCRSPSAVRLRSRAPSRPLLDRRWRHSRHHRRRAQRLGVDGRDSALRLSLRPASGNGDAWAHK